MAYTKYSLTPANNTAAPPDGAPEGMLPSAVNDTMRDMMAQIRDVGDGVRDGTYTMTTPKITGGTITGVTLTGNTLTNPVITGATLTTSAFNGTVGATTPSTGAFTTLTSNGATTFTAGTASTSTTTGTAVITGGLGVSGRINAANFDGIVGANTAAAGSFTTLSTSSTTTLSGLTASTALALDASKNVVSVTNTGTGNNVLATSPTLVTPVLGTPTSATLTNATGLPLTTGVTGTLPVANGGTGVTTSTGTGNNVLSDSPTLTGTIAGASLSLSSLTSGRVTYATTSGLLTDSANLTFDGTNLIVQNNGDVSARSYSTNASNQSFIQAVNSSNIYIGLLQYGASKAVYGALGAGGGALYSVANVTVMADNPTGFINFATGGNAERMRIDSSGNVGIGASSITNWGGYRTLQIGTSDSVLGHLALYNSTGRAAFVAGNTTSASFGSGINIPVVFEVNSTERMRIDSSGLLLQGSTSATFTMPSTGGASFKASTTSGGSPIVEIGNTDTTSGSDSSPALMVFKNSTTTTSDARFIQFSANGSATTMGAIVGNGSGLCQFANYSDISLKKNIQPLSGSLSKIIALKPSSFDMVSDSSHVNAGFIAQDVQKVYPEYVIENMANEGEKPLMAITGGMSGGFIAELVKAIQELKAEVDSLKQQLASR